MPKPLSLCDATISLVQKYSRFCIVALCCLILEIHSYINVIMLYIILMHISCFVFFFANELNYLLFYI